MGRFAAILAATFPLLLPLPANELLVTGWSKKNPRGFPARTCGDISGSCWWWNPHDRGGEAGPIRAELSPYRQIGPL